MNRSHRLITWPGVVLIGFLVLIPVVETTLQVWPFRFGDVRWRFGTAGVFSRALMTSLLGLMLGVVLAWLLDRRRAMRFLSVFCGLLALLLVLTMSLFALDGLQNRGAVRPELRGSFDAAFVVAQLKFLWSTVFLGLVAVLGWKASREKAAGPNDLPVLGSGVRGSRVP